jgi:hypothetical protein
VGITDILYEHVTLLLVAWSRVCWRAFVSTVKKLKVDIELVSTWSTAMSCRSLLQRGGCYNDPTQPVGVLVTLWTCVRQYLVRISAATTASPIHFSGSANSPHINTGIIFRLGHDHFLPNTLQFVIYLSSSTIFKCFMHARRHLWSSVGDRRMSPWCSSGMILTEENRSSWRITCPSATLNLNPLTWKTWWTANNASRWKIDEI